MTARWSETWNDHCTCKKVINLKSLKPMLMTASGKKNMYRKICHINQISVLHLVGCVVRWIFQRTPRNEEYCCIIPPSKKKKKKDIVKKFIQHCGYLTNSSCS